MAKKRGAKVDSKAAPKQKAIPVRLDLPEDDHERMERCARTLGLSKSSFARMAVLRLIRETEGGGA